MQCPKCKRTALKPLKIIGQTAHPDACPQCNGIWFDKGELHKALEINAETENIPEYALNGKTTLCPKCNVYLFEYCYPNTSVLVDGCRQCQGTWLDPAELDEIKKSTSYQESKRQICPKCQAPSAGTSTCQQCGIIFEKLNKQIKHSQAASSQIHSLLEDAVGFKIEQEKEWLEILSPFELSNRYQVVIFSKKNHFGHVYEHSQSLLNCVTRFFLGYLRPATLLFKDENECLLLTMKKYFRWYFHQLDLEDANNTKLGSIKRKFHFLRTNYAIKNKHGAKIMEIKGPLFWIPFIDQSFTFTKREQAIGCISKKWGGLLKESFTDADVYQARIDQDLSITEKSLLFAAAFLIDFVSFENNTDKTSPLDFIPFDPFD